METKIKYYPNGADDQDAEEVLLNDSKFEINMKITIHVSLPDGTMFTGTALSFERAAEELVAIERKCLKLNASENNDIPF